LRGRLRERHSRLLLLADFVAEVGFEFGDVGVSGFALG
jgi:hypothetical protein